MNHSTSETGHYRNISMFNNLLLFCESLGSKYTPSRSDLELTQMQEKYTHATDVMERLKTSQIDLARATAARATVFDDLSKLATRVVNTFEASNPTAEVLKYAKHFLAKIRGRRIGAATADPNVKAENATAEMLRQISSRQTSFDALLDHFEQLVRIVGTDAAYQPNETDLTANALHTKIQQLSMLNTTVAKAVSKQKLMIAERQQALYAPVSGITDTALSVKKYIKGVFSAESAEAKAAGNYTFTKMN